DCADQLDARGLDLEALALALRRHEFASGDDGGAAGEVFHHALVIGEVRAGHDLDGGETGAVAPVHERKPRLGITPGTHPALDRDFAAGTVAGNGLPHAE